VAEHSSEGASKEALSGKTGDTSAGAAQDTEFPKVYEPGLIEPRWAKFWVDEQLFHADAEASGEIFSIVIPPPNVTGYIHIGHMLEHTQIDVLTRWHRMRGAQTLWLPGMDHAGISTQVVVERELAKQNLTRKGLGREEFERRVWEWKAHSGGTIKKQMIRLGDSCDWSREKFTLDPPLYRAVLEAFLRLYHEGLIYRGRYVVNWCPRCQTALSDLETVHEERRGHLWYIRYPAVGSSESLVVATTRPETMLGDTAVAVNPEDERYKQLIGKKLRLPLMNREIPVIADAAVDRQFGTGAVKVTPAHDPNDFEMGRRHKLAEVDIMTEDGHMNPNAGPYASLDRFEARKRVVTDLQSQGLLVKIEDHTHAVGVCDRCKTVVEPRVSMQWFCKMRPLADAAIAAVEQGHVSIVPENQRKIFLDWLTNIRDWCISRQLWWGHRIPMWHCSCGGMTPARDSQVAIVEGRALPASPPEKCAKCGGGKLEQDPDVLDTWFSSGLWPLSTLGWPDDTRELRAFYPTTLLISGYDILFFWDARMVMLSLHLASGKTTAQRIPFRTLYLHSLVRDAQGQKMSKMRGNVVDPLEWMEQFGTDALRFTLAIKAAPGTDIALSEDAVLGYKAFANKIWNAARFVFVNLKKFQAATGMNVDELAAPQVRAAAPYPAGDAVSLADRWIFSRLAEAIATVDDALENFRFHEAAHIVYHFFWGDFCDWYIEWVKPAMAEPDRRVALPAWRNLFAVFDAALRLLHPFMPFLTEELWHRLPQQAAEQDKNARSIALQQFPRPAPQWSDPDAEQEVKLLQEVIEKARDVRADLKLDPKRRVPAEVYTPTASAALLIQQNHHVIERLGMFSELRLSSKPFDTVVGLGRATPQFELRIADAEVTNTKERLARVEKEMERVAIDIKSKQERLADSSFRDKAPAEIVRRMEATVADRRVQLKKTLEQHPNWIASAQRTNGYWLAVMQGVPGSEFEGNFYLYGEDWSPPHPAIGMQSYSAAEIAQMFASGELSLLRGTLPAASRSTSKRQASHLT
jgi:valyl-tRNA synthetase